MKKLLIVALCSAMGLYGGGKSVAPVVSPIAEIAQEDVNPWYVGVGIIPYSLYRSHCPTGCPYEDYTYGAMVRGGYEINEYFGIEARALRTFWGAGKNGGERFEHYGIYAKPMYPVSERFNAYGLLGYGWTSSINSGGNGNLPEVETWGFSWGVGIEFDLSDTKSDFQENVTYDRPFDGYADQEHSWGLFIDYQSLMHGKAFSHYTKDNKLIEGKADIVHVISMGITYDF